MAECSSYIIAFRGLHEAFDYKAFNQYVEIKKSCGEVFSWKESEKANDFIVAKNMRYELYGFSKGAETVAKLLPKLKNKPVYILTVGAYKSVDVDFTKYNIPYDNFYDYSGIGQTSPGKLFRGISHQNIQAYINQFF